MFFLTEVNTIEALNWMQRKTRDSLAFCGSCTNASLGIYTLLVAGQVLCGCMSTARVCLHIHVQVSLRVRENVLLRKNA